MPTVSTTYTLDVDGIRQTAAVNVLPALSISDLTLNSNSVVVSAVNLVPEQTYDLFSSPDLLNWTVINVPVTPTGTNGTASFTDTNALPGSDSARFYRVERLAP